MLKSISKYKNPLTFLLFTFLSIIAIGANPLADETVGPFDLLVSYKGWSSVAPRDVSVRNYERSDVLDAMLPYGIQEKKKLYYKLKNLNEKKLDLAWDFYYLIWHPSEFIFNIIPNDPLAFYFAMLFRLIIAGFGAYLFLKLFLSFPASVWGGIVYMLCGFQAAWLFWPQVETSMWIPWLLWATASYLKYNKPKYLFLLTLVSIFIIKGHFPSVAAYGFYSIALFILIYNIFNCRSISSFFLKTTLPFLFIIFAFLISADYLFSLSAMIQNVDLSHRINVGTALRLNNLHNLYNPFKDIRVETSVYSGFLAFIFSLASFSYFLLRKKSKKIISVYIFSLLLMIISIVLAYGLINHNLIRKIPVFSSNPWGRMSVIIGLSMALLSSFFIEMLQKLKRKSSIIFRLVTLCLILFFLVQFADQKNYFNKFNGSTRSEYFYPVTPSIEFVSQNIRDYQSVIGDFSFHLSGILSAYNFFEWYHHSFRTSAEKKLLFSLIPNSYSSPTSFAISAQNINFSSPLVNLFAVKCILVDADELNPLFFKQPEISKLPSPPLPFSKLCQYFYLSENRNLSGINLFLANYKDKHFDSDVLLKLYNSESDKLIAVSKKNKRHIKDNTWTYFDFNPNLQLESGEYKFSLNLLNKNTHSKLSVWSTRRNNNIKSYLAVDDSKTELSFNYSLHEANIFIGEEYQLHCLEPNITVIENLKCPEGPYLISDINNYPPIIEFANLNYTSSVEQIKITLPKDYTGYLIIPRPYDNDYLAYVDGKLQCIDQYLGVFPAIRVHNNSQVLIEKKPFYFMTGRKISIVSLFFFIILLIFHRKKQAFKPNFLP